MAFKFIWCFAGVGDEENSGEAIGNVGEGANEGLVNVADVAVDAAPVEQALNGLINPGGGLRCSP